MIQKLYLAGRRQAGYLLRRRQFHRTLAANGLTLDWHANRSQFHVLQDIFGGREYADYFPFYQDATVVDIGAHYGFFSLFASLNTGPGARILSLEPSSANYKMLRDNVARARRTNITALNMAVAGSTGTAVLQLAAAATNSLVTGDSPNAANVERVEALSLVDLFERQKLETVDFLKMDCEGAEYEILENASDATLARINVVSMEFHDRKSPKYNAEWLLARLRRAGFSTKKFSYSPTGIGLNYGKLIVSRIHP